MLTFRHGVASGDPLPDRVRLWTRLSGARGPTAVRFAVARDAELCDVVVAGEAVARPDDDFTVHVDAGGLEPGTRYHFGFSTRDARSPIGRTRTAPAAGVERLRLAVVSCAKYTAGYFNAYARMAERDDLDLVVHLGDYIYDTGNDGRLAPGPAIGRRVEPERPLVTLADYRARYAHYRLDPDLQALHAAHPLVATLDDHDLCNDAWRDGAGGHDPARDGDWHARKAAALRAWREWLPVRPPEPDRPQRVYRSLALGALAELMLLDERTERDRPATSPEREADGRTMLGREQFAWLAERLAGSTARWKLVGNGVMLAPVYSELVADELGGPLGEIGVLSHTDSGPDPDQWDGYPAERARLLDRMEDAGDVVVLSGDVHTAWAIELPGGRDGDGPPVAVELVTTSVTSENLDEHLRTPPGSPASHRVEAHLRDLNPHVRWCDLDRHGYLLVDVRPDRIEASWHAVRELHRRDAGEELLARYRVRAGVPRLERID